MNTNKKFMFSLLLVILLLLIGCSKTIDNVVLPQNKLTPAEQFKTATEASSPNSKEFKNVFD